MGQIEREYTGVDSRGLRWYREFGIILAFYMVYSAVRNQFGSASVSPRQALDNALTVIQIEKALGLFFEPHVQGFFLGWGEGFIRFWNLYYGTLHFVVTAGVLIWVYRRHARSYPLWRNTLGITTALGLVGFSLFPLMPPRLLGVAGPYGGASGNYAGRFVDTLQQFPMLWSFDSTTMQSVSNQYAAMPSLHVAWSLWCTLAVLALCQRRSVRLTFAVYPAATSFAIVVTANHYWLDAVGGTVVVLAAYWAATRIESFKASRRGRRLDDDDNDATTAEDEARTVLVA